MNDQSREDRADLEMFALVGQAITGWSFFEQTLCNIFIVCMGPCPTRPGKNGGLISFLDGQVPTAVFFSIESFRGKLGLVDAALQNRLINTGAWGAETLDAWAKLKERARKLSLKRNALAHGAVTHSFENEGKFLEPRLMPAYGSPKWWAETGSNPAGNFKTPTQLNELMEAFALLDENLREFYRELAQHPNWHKIFDDISVRLVRSHRRLNPARAIQLEQEFASNKPF